MTMSREEIKIEFFRKYGRILWYLREKEIHQRVISTSRSFSSIMPRRFKYAFDEKNEEIKMSKTPGCAVPRYPMTLYTNQALDEKYSMNEIENARVVVYMSIKKLQLLIKFIKEYVMLYKEHILSIPDIERYLNELAEISKVVAHL